ncbi:AraC family transcriptional regulator [Priestia endophytica]|uniref:AraC family transcriptional regulator n=1 Tax=Priestia endophytica TaxID=135735 RepID=UPI000DCA5C9B|nr:AraC family transcriptional regulator [Priestia endophytica]RAS83649.1 AraC family transcriptional regulator [Priestia endophytica]
MNNEVFNPYEIDFIYKDRSSNELSLHTHHRYEVFYFHSGKCNYLVGSNIYMLNPGDILLMNGMTLHSPKVEPENEYVRSVVHFEHEGIKPFLQSLHSLNVLRPFQEFNNYRLSVRGRDKEEVESALEKMSIYFNQKDMINYNRFRLSFLDLLYFIFEKFEHSISVETEAPNHKERNVQRIITFLENNYTNDITLETLQSHMHMNKFYLSKLFKEITGTTIFNFLYEYRINEAKTMFFIDKSISVTEVCYQVGFKHLSHFSRLFKQQVGISPDTFKKMYGE